MITKKRTIGFLLIVGLLIVGVASAYAEGNPFERLEATILELKTKIAELEALIDSIPEGPEGPPGPSGFGPPDYDSDWRTIAKSPATLGLEHGLGTTDLFIYVVGSRGLVPGGIHHKYYGYFRSGTAEGVQGLQWEATSTHITLRRGGYDSNWDNVRVYIWIIPTNLVDTDSDGLSDILENEVYGTEPDNPDTDGDGLTDGDEVRVQLTNPLNTDSDNDMLSDGEEVLEYLTNPRDPDTDGDTYSDGAEVAAGTDPLDLNSHPSY